MALQIKGSVLKTRLAFVKDLAASGVEEVLARLPEEDRITLGSLLATSWYPFELGKRLDQAIVDRFGGGKVAFFERLGEASAEKNLTTVHRNFLVEGDPHAFLARAPMVYSFYYDQGRREYERSGDREAVLTTVGAEAFSVPDCATVVGWHRKALLMCGATNPQVVEEECRARGGATCRYRLSWDA
jgi:uncharacterized protein (TIGR02265 family)